MSCYSHIDSAPSVSTQEGKGAWSDVTALNDAAVPQPFMLPPSRRRPAIVQGSGNTGLDQSGDAWQLDRGSTGFSFDSRPGQRSSDSFDEPWYQVLPVLICCTIHSLLLTVQSESSNKTWSCMTSA